MHISSLAIFSVLVSLILAQQLPLHQIEVAQPVLVDSISYEVHAHWMRVAIQALYDTDSSCPFQAYGTAIVNHTAGNGNGKLICTGANAVIATGNPTLHGEIAAINNCTVILADKHKLSPAEIQAAWSYLTLYTTGEACPMCATSIRWAGFERYVYATSIERLIELGWHQATISSREIFDRSSAMGPATAIVSDVLANETDTLLAWQFDQAQSCPEHCSREGRDKSGHCVDRRTPKS